MICLGHRRFDYATVCARDVGWSVPNPAGQTYRTSRFQSCSGGAWKSTSVSRGSSGLPRALRIILDVVTSLRMSEGAMLLRTGSQPVIVHRTAPVMVIMVLFSGMLTRLVCASKLEHSTQPYIAEGQGWCTKSFFAPAPQVVPASMCSKLLQARVFAATFRRWGL